MDRAQPILKKSLERRRIENERKIHLDKLRTIKSSIDCHNKANWTHLRTKSKKMQMDEERYCEIERDNALLLAKMSSISRGKGEIDAKEPDRYNKYSMNIYVRTMEQSKIQSENQSIVNRIRERKGDFDHTKWDEDWKGTEQMIDRICEYPFVLSKTQGMSGTRRSMGGTRGSLRGTQKSKRGLSQSRGGRSKSVPRGRQTKRMESTRQAESETRGGKQDDSPQEGEVDPTADEEKEEKKDEEKQNGENEEGQQPQQSGEASQEAPAEQEQTGEEEGEEGNEKVPGFLRKVVRKVDDKTNMGLEEKLDNPLTKLEEKRDAAEAEKAASAESPSSNPESSPASS
ncbi:uncharacterized protein MONOS_5376 [Monocercomonoides exilis]|uniref:uncharacterized protein n=1 Tax=Monocercomonoides exilis TaxID=2049356 RepID=UPI003559B23A|nr:hypothetical protein MONOS_5376 [Monocercomonoides exilis]|eukprot:MONOS_5376.1-p1 / transcript=MONOS_5376.1 / gene=MONOS_5376 / organism=Monocercomonoides_exilis_PA203 / gene_product=novel protein / transcript_product=novel protein / location=Mono_scaffold00155:81239-82510(-) / protein_length=342 / sequence_SO=supercontig / SO=protein_coding / is_pseudo=false